MFKYVVISYGDPPRLDAWKMTGTVDQALAEWVDNCDPSVKDVEVTFIDAQSDIDALMRLNRIDVTWEERKLPVV